MSADDGSRIQARVSRVPVFQPRRLWYLLSDIDRRAIGTFPLPERSLESFRCASGFFNVTTSLPSAVLSSFIAISIPSFRVSSSAPFRYYGRPILSPSGGWWTRPSNWASNTAISCVLIGIMTFGAWRLSAQKEVGSPSYHSVPSWLSGLF